MNTQHRDQLPPRLDVMCCCQPDNVLGTAPRDASLPVRKWEDDAGGSGVAFQAHDADLEKVAGFRPAKKGKGGKKRPTRTWKESRRPKR